MFEPSEEHFQERILDNPDDKYAIGIYADWLEEQGDSRSQLIHIFQKCFQPPFLESSTHSRWTAFYNQVSEVKLNAVLADLKQPFTSEGDQVYRVYCELVWLKLKENNDDVLAGKSLLVRYWQYHSSGGTAFDWESLQNASYLNRRQYQTTAGLNKLYWLFSSDLQYYSIGDWAMWFIDFIRTCFALFDYVPDADSFEYSVIRKGS